MLRPLLGAVVHTLRRISLHRRSFWACG
jgi:hypothetical protein